MGQSPVPPKGAFAESARLMLAAVLIGAVTGLLTVIVLGFVEGGTSFLWETLPAALGLDQPAAAAVFTVLILTLTGGVVGLIAARFKSRDGGGALKEIVTTGRIELRDVPVPFITSMISLIGGASLGPEASLMDLNGAVGTWIGDRFKSIRQNIKSATFSGLSGTLGAFFGSPFGSAMLALEIPGLSDVQYRLVLSSVLAACTGYIVYFGIVGSVLGGLITFPDYTSPTLLHIALAVPFSVAGAVVSLVTLVGAGFLRRSIKRLAGRPIMVGALAGLFLGVLGALIPMTRFSGEHQVSSLVTDAATVGAFGMILLGFAKLAATHIALSTGFKGGVIFPTIFAGVAIGSGLSVLFPSIPSAVIVLPLTAAMMSSMARIPVSTIIFLSFLSQADAVPMIAIGSVVGYLITLLPLTAIRARQETHAELLEDADAT